MSGARGAGLVLDSNVGLWGASALSVCLYCLGLVQSGSAGRVVGQLSRGCLVCLYRKESR